ncbi:hypothetical protein [Mesorhizobium sp.]|uniref:hypothetical protein n=1 Tax=Mesorhizobium sp. TaxID=1871066 RepID=UPI00257AEA86|nr:hypothetical protein [Mesorhizobium sp.]
MIVLALSISNALEITLQCLMRFGVATTNGGALNWREPILPTAHQADGQQRSPAS